MSVTPTVTTTTVTTTTVTTTTTVKTALKEWAVAVQALSRGETILLLRKGGIREQGFQVSEPRFWLYPTYEHQKPHLLKPPYEQQVMPVESGWHPETVEIGAWAEVTHSFEVSAAAVVESLLPFHIWTADWVTERLKWKPRLPLTVLLLRVYRLNQPQVIPYRSEYGGCKSWIQLESVPLLEATPTLSDFDYQQQVEAISHVIATAG